MFCYFFLGTRHKFVSSESEFYEYSKRKKHFPCRKFGSYNKSADKQTIKTYAPEKQINRVKIAFWLSLFWCGQWPDK